MLNRMGTQSRVLSCSPIALRHARFIHSSQDNELLFLIYKSRNVSRYFDANIS